MQITLSNCDDVTPEKAEFIELKIGEMYDFALESKRLLCNEAHTTLNWLFAIVVGGTSYAVNQIVDGKVQWWLLIPVLLMVTAGVIQSVLLFHGALRALGIYPKGNSPQNLITDDFMQLDLKWMRLNEAAAMHERIKSLLDQNRSTGKAINRARWCVVILPFFAVAGSLVGLLFTS